MPLEAKGWNRGTLRAKGRLAAFARDASVATAIQAKRVEKDTGRRDRHPRSGLKPRAISKTVAEILASLGGAAAFVRGEKDGRRSRQAANPTSGKRREGRAKEETGKGTNGERRAFSPQAA